VGAGRLGLAVSRQLAAGSLLGLRARVEDGLQHDGIASRLTLCCFWLVQVLPSDIDLLHPPAEQERLKHKLKRLVQSPNSFFMDVKCQGCFNM
jgi:hypothetical protein